MLYPGNFPLGGARNWEWGEGGGLEGAYRSRFSLQGGALQIAAPRAQAHGFRFAESCSFANDLRNLVRLRNRVEVFTMAALWFFKFFLGVDQ